LITQGGLPGSVPRDLDIFRNGISNGSAAAIFYPDISGDLHPAIQIFHYMKGTHQDDKQDHPVRTGQLPG
jgi:hypothetical protein